MVSSFRQGAGGVGGECGVFARRIQGNAWRHRSGMSLIVVSLLACTHITAAYMSGPSLQPPGAMLRGVASRNNRWGDALEEKVRRKLSEPQGRSRRRWDHAGDFAGPWLLYVKGAHAGMRERVAAAMEIEGGADRIRYVPSDTLLLVTTGNAVAKARRKLPEIAWAGPLQPHHRVDPELYTLLLGGESGELVKGDGGGGGDEEKEIQEQYDDDDDFDNVDDVDGVQDGEQREGGKAGRRGNSTRRRIERGRGGARRKLLSREGRVELYVVMPGGSDGHETAVEWTKRLEQEGIGQGAVDVRVRAASGRKLIVSFVPVVEANGAVLAWIAQQPQALWVGAKERFKSRNKWAKGVMQSGRAQATPLWDKGIRGEGQIVGIADTGIQHDLCYFHDPSWRVPINRLDMRHRKIVYYKYEQGWGSSVDEDGHGSHTTGSIAGEAAEGSDEAEFNGMAPKAKLFFDDIFLYDDLTPPDDLEADLFPQPFQHGAKIRSESWGGTSIFYTASAMECDSYAWRHREFLIVWAGGNDGDLGMFSIGSPATGKNQLSVGAQYSTAASLELQDGDKHFFEIRTGHDGTVATVEGVWASFGSRMPFSGEIVKVEPFNACGRITNSAAINDKIALVVRGICNFVDKAKRLQAAGATAMLVQDTPGGETVMMGGRDGGSVTIPSMAIANGYGNKILEGLESGAKAEMIWESSGPDPWQEHLASFSAKGPTGDGRTKPEVLTVGADIWSARGRAPPNGPGTCGGVPPASTASVADMGGTSMAAPVAAGGAALIRQYFMEGWFPTGRKTVAGGFAPSGALLRAVMMNSGRPLGGGHDVSGDGSDRWESLDTRLPNNQQGWGSLRLETSLYFDPPTLHSATRMYIRDDEGPFHTPCLSTGETFAQSFSVRSGEPFRAMLAWTDPPATLVAERVLVNDLDLRVHSAVETKVRWGNRMESVPNPGLDSDREEMPDRINNHELVDVAKPFSGVYTVTVLGHSIPEGPQCFALVVTGDFEEVQTANADDICPGGCGNHGICRHGQCVCDQLWTGTTCDTEIQVFRASTLIESIVWPYGWQYFAIDLGPNPGGSFTIKLKRLFHQGDPDVFVSQGTEVLPAIDRFARLCGCGDGMGLCGCFDMTCDACGETAHNQEHRFETAAEGLGGVFIVGVSGYCCEPARYTLSLVIESIGCDGVKGSGLEMDGCGECGGLGECLGCDGVKDSNQVFDACGECGGDNSTCAGCDGVPNSGLLDDGCGVCDGEGLCKDCNGVLNGDAVVDQCDVCGGDGKSCRGCDGFLFSGARVDVCGECGGGKESCSGCDGVPFSGIVSDECGICGGDNSTCAGCDGVPNSGSIVDACGVCGGGNRSCAGCDGVPYSGKKVDRCGVCGGDGKVCRGCDGVVDSPAKLDACGVCKGDNSTCSGCDGLPMSGKTLDRCQVCGGDDACAGCDGVPNSKLETDQCGICGGKGDTCVVPGQDSVLSILLILTPFGTEDFVDASMRSKLQSALSIKLQIPFSNITISDIQRLRRHLSRQFHGVGRQETTVAPKARSALNPRVEIRPGDSSEDQARLAQAADGFQARSALNPRVEISVEARVGPAGGDTAQVALAQLAKISQGELDERIAAVFGKQDAKVTLASSPKLLPAWSFSKDASGVIFNDASSLLIGFVVYVMLGGCVNAALYMRTKRGQPQPGTALLLWATFGPLGAHRFYTRTPKAGLLFFLTLGLGGIGWLADLYVQRHFLFQSQGLPEGNGPKQSTLSALKKLAHSNFSDRVRSKNLRRYQKGLADSEEEAVWHEGGRRGAKRVPLADLEDCISDLEVPVSVAAPSRCDSHGNGLEPVIENSSGETSTKGSANSFSAYKDKWRLQAPDHADDSNGELAFKAQGEEEDRNLEVDSHPSVIDGTDHVSDDRPPDGAFEGTP